MSDQYQRVLDAWRAEPQNTARSVIATIFGDTIAPIGNTVWLAQLFQLTEPFGFSERLVRTSLYRLANEHWCRNERIGRQSRYALTRSALDETRAAEQRIYQLPALDWSGSWTAVFIDSPGVPESEREQLRQRLSWQGFLPLRDGIVVSPTHSLQEAKASCNRSSPSSNAALATLTFGDVEGLVANGFFTKALPFAQRARSYTDFIERYKPLRGLPANPAEAFCLRTMLVHDLRRIRLSGPDIPNELLPDDWPASEAFDLAAILYPKATKLSSPWLSEIFGIAYPSLFCERFA